MASRRKRREEWTRNKQGGWTISLGYRGNRVRLFQKRRDGVFQQKVWDPTLKRYDVVSLRNRDRTEAERLGKEFLAALLKGETRASGWIVTLGDLWRRYRDESQSHLQSAETTKEDAKSRAAILLSFFGSECDVSTLTQDDVKAYEVRRRAGGLVGRNGRVTGRVSARSVDADLVLLRTMLKWAMSVRTPSGKRWLHENPLQGIRNVREQNPRRPVATWERYLKTRTAMQDLAADAKSNEQRTMWTRLELALLLAQSTGRRLQEGKAFGRSDAGQSVDRDQGLSEASRGNCGLGIREGVRRCPANGPSPVQQAGGCRGEACRTAEVEGWPLASIPKNVGNCASSLAPQAGGSGWWLERH